MNILISTMLLFLGFILLIKGADYFVEGASSLARKMNVSQITIGLTVVAFGTSSPELLVNIFSATQGKEEIGFGNVIGSNILNLLLILGTAAVVNPIKIKRNTVWREIPFLLLSFFVLFFLCNDAFFFPGNSSNVLSRIDSLILILLFVIFMIYVFHISRVHAKVELQIKNLSTLKTSIYILSGLAGLFIGGKLAVENATLIARELEISDRIIAITVIATGTSLPELFTTIAAARKNKFDIAVGNVIGSSIFNVLFILPISGLIAPLPYDTKINFDTLVMSFGALVIFFAMFTGKRQKLDRWEGFLLVLFYVIYLILLVSKINLV